MGSNPTLSASLTERRPVRWDENPRSNGQRGSTVRRNREQSHPLRQVQKCSAFSGMNSQRPIGPLDPFGRIQTHRGSGHYRQFLIHSCTRVPMTLPTPLRPGEAPRFPRPRAIPGRANGGSVAPSADAPSLDDLMAPFSPRATPDAGTAEAAHPVDWPRGRMSRVLHEEFQGFHLRL